MEGMSLRRPTTGRSDTRRLQRRSVKRRRKQATGRRRIQEDLLLSRPHHLQLKGAGVERVAGIGRAINAAAATNDVIRGEPAATMKVTITAVAAAEAAVVGAAAVTAAGPPRTAAVVLVVVVVVVPAVAAGAAIPPAQ